MGEPLQALDQVRVTAIDLAMKFGPKLMVAILILVAGLVVGRWLTILFTRPFRIGDYISIAKEEGEVLDIRLDSTTLGHPDLSRVVIPNRTIVGEILHNFIHPWVNVPDYGSATSEINRAVLETFRDRSIMIPLPQREVRMLEAGT